jgi:hypothetical protein
MVIPELTPGLTNNKTGADCALSHDNDWSKRSPVSPWNGSKLFLYVATSLIVRIDPR